MIRTPAGFGGEDRIKRYLDYYQPSYGVMMLSAGQAFSPASLFAAGEQGVWHDPSDFSTMFQDSAGTTPVTAVEQPVGLILDKSKGLVLGPELVANPGGPFVSTTGYSAGGSATISVDTGRLKVAQTVGFTDGVLCALPNNAFSISTVISFTVDLGSSTVVQVQAGNGNFGNGSIITVNITASGTYNITTTTLGSGASGLTFKASSASNFFLSSVSVKELPGNHASQSTSASRPVLSARVNLLTKTEQFDDAVWAKQGGNPITANQTTAPDGTNTADLFTAQANGPFANYIYQPNLVLGATSYRVSIRAKKGTQKYILIDLYSPSIDYGAVFDLDAGTYVGSAGLTAFDSTPTITPIGNGWYELVATKTVAANTYSLAVSTATGNNAIQATGDTIYIWGADLRVTNDGVGLPAYQRVNTSTDYDTTGFPYYLRFDGTDDSLATAAIDFTATDKVAVFAGVRKLSDAALGMLAELSVSVGANNGSFYLVAPSGGGGNDYSFVSKGTASTGTGPGASYASPVTNVIAGFGNISGDSTLFRINAVQVGTNSGDQGTGNYGNYPLYIGRRGGTTLTFNGRLYSLIVRGAQSTATEITNTETWVNGKTYAYA